MSDIKRELKVAGQTAVNEDGLLIAFASNDRQQVNQHFGQTAGFSVYRLLPDGAAFLSHVVEFAQLPAEHAQHEHHRLAGKLGALQGCHAVYSIACGPGAVRRLMALGIQPVTVSDGEEIKALLKQLYQLMQQPKGWVARAMRGQAQSESTNSPKDEPDWLKNNIYH